MASHQSLSAVRVPLFLTVHDTFKGLPMLALAGADAAVS